MIKINNLRKIPRLFNQGIWKVKDAVVLKKYGYLVNFKNGKVTSITKEVEEK